MDKIIISGDGSGDFNCDGKADQVQINAAFAYQKDNPEYPIHLKGPFKYVVNNQILTSNSFTWTGDKDAVLTIATDRLWNATIPVIRQANPKQSESIIKKMSGFTIDGNADAINAKYAAAQGKKELRGDGFYNLIEMSYGTIEISGMTLRNSLNDGVITRYAHTVFRDNTVKDLGHEALFAKKCSVEHSGNRIKTMTNSGGRIMDCMGPVSIHDNTIWTEFGYDAGGPGLQIQFTKSDACRYMKDVEIWNNTIYDTYGPGIWLVAFAGSPYSRAEASGVHIHDNTFSGCGTHPKYDWLAGIVTSGFYDTLIENNVFDGCYGASVLIKNAVGLKPNGSSGKYNTIVKDNIIKNTIKMKVGIGGQGIRNETPSVHTVTSENNYIFDNESGPYYNVSSDSDILHAPDDEPEDPDNPSFVEFECSEKELEKIITTYPKRTFYKRL